MSQGLGEKEGFFCGRSSNGAKDRRGFALKRAKVRHARLADVDGGASSNNGSTRDEPVRSGAGSRARPRHLFCLARGTYERIFDRFRQRTVDRPFIGRTQGPDRPCVSHCRVSGGQFAAVRGVNERTCAHSGGLFRKLGGDRLARAAESAARSPNASPGRVRTDDRNNGGLQHPPGALRLSACQAFLANAWKSKGPQMVIRLAGRQS